MKTKLTFLIIAAALAAATAGRAQTVISYSTDGGHRPSKRAAYGRPCWTPPRSK